MMGKIPIIFLLLFLISSKPVFAARDLSILSSDKSSIFGDEYLMLTASTSGFTDGETIFMKGAFFQEGSTNYFGFTKSIDNWIKNSETAINQNKIEIGSWDKKVLIKSDFADSGYKGEGGYKLKLGFYYYTSGGNLSSVNWSSNNVNVDISEPDPTATPVPTKKSETVSNLDDLSNQEELLSVSSTPKLLLSISPVSRKSTSNSAIPTSVLGVKTESKEMKDEEDKKVLVDSVNNIPFLSTIAGGVFLFGAGIMIFLKMKRRIMNNE